MEIVEIKCCESIDLKNIINIKDSNILQTVDIYDEVTIRCDNKQKGIFINSNIDLSDDIKDKLKCLIDLFLKYTGKQVNNLIVDIKKNNITLMDNYCNILAGLLVGLNVCFQTNLTTHELIFLSKNIDNLIAYYLICGYRKIDYNHKNYNIGDNNFNKYFLIEKFNQEELKRIKDFVANNNLVGDTYNNYYFVAVKDTYPVKAVITLKKMFNKHKIYDFRNASANKVLVKYLNNFY